MITFGEQKTIFYDITKTNSANNDDSSRARRMLNGKNKEILSLKDWYFMEKERTATFVASQAEYQLPADYSRMIALWVTIGGVNYYPEEVYDLEYWKYLNSTTVSSDITTHFLILEDSIQLYPVPSSTSGTIHMVYRRLARDMSADDYTTGTIAATIGSRTVTGSGTTWASAMIGRFINIAGRWYEIENVGSTTSITLVKPSLDTVSGATYTIGEVSAIPAEFQDLVWRGAVSDFYDFKGDANTFKGDYKERLVLFVRQYGSGKKSTSQVIKPTDRSRVSLVNQNDYPTGLHQ